MNEWERRAREAAALVEDAATRFGSRGDLEPGTASRALDAVRAFRTTDAGPDGDRYAAYATVLGAAAKALRLLERSGRIASITGEEPGSATAAGAGSMIGRTALEAAARALSALGSGSRDERAEAALSRIAAAPLKQAGSRVNLLYKLAREERPDLIEDEEDEE